MNSPHHGLSFLGVRTWCLWETALVQNGVGYGVETGMEQADCKEIDWDYSICCGRRDQGAGLGQDKKLSSVFQSVIVHEQTPELFSNCSQTFVFLHRV